MKKRIGFFVLISGITLFGFAQQDKHFSMFTESQVFMNPATAGFSPGKAQLFANFRTQWASVSANPYKTAGVSADWRMLDNGNFLGAGINFYNDVSGDTKYKINEISVPINYAIKLSKKNQHLSVGIQPGWYQRSLNNESVSWDNQWTGSGFNTALNSNEVLQTGNVKVNRFDISAGIFWNMVFPKQNKLSLGLSAGHLSGQKVNFMTIDSRLYRRFIFHGQYSFNTSRDFSIIPAFYTFFQGPNREISLGSNFRYLIKGSVSSNDFFEQTAISIGLYYRTGDALMLNIMLDIAGFSIGAAYDVNTSGLNAASSGKGAYEFFLRYRLKKGKK